MKYYFILVLFSCLSASAQTGTIHVKKIEGCDFQLVADSNLIDRVGKISGISVTGRTSSDANALLVIQKYSILDEIFVSKNTFEKDLKDLCDTKEYKLEKIEVKGKDSGHIYLHFFFRKQ